MNFRGCVVDAAPQTVDETTGFRQSDESFGQAFSKACAVKGAEPFSPSAEGEISFTAFLFANFFFAPAVSKKKWRMGFVHCYKLYTFGLQLAPGSDLSGEGDTKRATSVDLALHLDPAVAELKDAADDGKSNAVALLFA